MDDWKNGAMRIKWFAIAKANMLEMRIKMDFMKCMSIPWKVFGPCSALGCDLIGGSRRRNFHFIWAFEFIHNMRKRGKTLLELLIQGVLGVAPWNP